MTAHDIGGKRSATWVIATILTPAQRMLLLQSFLLMVGDGDGCGYLDPADVTEVDRELADVIQREWNRK